MTKVYQIATTRMRLIRSGPFGLGSALTAIIGLAVQPSLAQSLPLPAAVQLARAHAPMVNAGTLLAFAWHESRLRPFAVHDNITGQSFFPASAAEAVSLARTRVALGHGLDLGIMQVSSVNLARAGLTLTTAFDAGESMRAGAMILTADYRHCLRGNISPTGAEEQAALRCTASLYNTGREQAGILSGYQASVWRAAAQVVPAIQLSATGIASFTPVPPATPEDVVAPEPRRPPPALEDLLHATPPIPDASDSLSDALHLTTQKDVP